MSSWGNDEPAPRRARTATEQYVDQVGRFTETIRTTRMVLITLVVLGTLLGAIAAGSMFLLPAIYGVVSALVVYIFMGWLEHTLRLLCGVYVNGHPSANHN